MVTIGRIIEKAKVYLPHLNEERVHHAYEFARKAHEGQKRFSGEPYIVHPLNVTNLLLDYHPDEDSIVTALLHDVAEDTPVTLEEIEKSFGPVVRKLCWGLVKLSKVRSKLNDPQVENLRKLFLAMAEDIRVVMLKLCDRLHNMKTLHYVKRHKQERIAQETMNVYAPIAARLGIYRLKTELEDLCFKHLNPESYNDIYSQLEKTEKWRHKYIDMAKKILVEMLAKEGIHAVVDGRVKGLYSIYRKLKKKGKSVVDDIFDVFAMRIMLPDMYKSGKEYTGHLYTTLGIIHNQFTPLANRFKDYVAVPKVNGYRSLHTTVIGVGPKNYTQPTEIQIRSVSMHNAAEYGIAAHWIYEEKGSTSNKDFSIDPTRLAIIDDGGDESEFFEQQKEWITDLKKIGRQVKNNQELLGHLKSDVFQDRIFVLTPRGDVKDLPKSATPIDFAYSVHTDVGNQCIGAKVNGSMVPIDYQLKNGEVVEIVTRKNAHPSQSWLSFVKTTHAINRIKFWFKTRDEAKNIKDGKDILNEKLLQLGKPQLDIHLTLLKKYDGKKRSMKEREEILSEIGKGTLLPSTVVRKIFTVHDLLGAAQKQEAKKFAAPPQIINKKEIKKERAKIFKDGEEPTKTNVVIGGLKNMPYYFVKCCKATLEDDLVGFITRGKGVSLHKKSCKVVRHSDVARLVPVRVSNLKKVHGIHDENFEHEEEQGSTYAVQVLVEADDRIGLVRDITATMANENVNILHFFQDPPKTSLITINFIVEISDLDQLETLLYKLEKIDKVRRAIKVN